MSGKERRKNLASSSNEVLQATVVALDYISVVTVVTEA